ncbi:MAG: COX15/CtaA family protein [Planctomycetaceae bacterium]
MPEQSSPPFLALVVSSLLVAMTAVLLCFGALVTTYDAAMAVPDWPATYGHNMFLFPLAEWLGGPWDLFLEHGHRLLGAAVGLLTLILAGLVWTTASTPQVRGLAVAATLLVVVQGLLGGMRVLLDDKTIAKVHACTGPLFFAVATAIMTLLVRQRPSRQRPFEERLYEQVPVRPTWSSGGFVPPALVVASYLQLVAGAQLRHLDAALTPGDFRWLVAIHLLGAAAVTLFAFLAVVSWQPHDPPWARRWARLIAGVVIGQLLLGCGAWLVNYGVPAGWLQDAWTPSTPLVARSVRGALVVTGHTVLGMLILGSSVVLMLVWGGGPTLARSARRWREASA